MTLRINTACLLIVWLNGLPLPEVHAQKVPVDRQIWLGTSLKIDLPKGWSVTGQYRLRRINDASDYKGSYLFLTGDYRINKHFGAFVNYRFADVDVGKFHRFAIAAEGRYKLGDFTLSARPMLQRQNQYFATDNEQAFDIDMYLRPRAQLKYHPARHWDFYIYAEPFFGVLKNQWKLDWWQNSIGMKYQYAKGKQINLFYIWQPDFTHKHSFTYHIFAIDFEFAIKPGKKKGKESDEIGDTSN